LRELLRLLLLLRLFFLERMLLRFFERVLLRFLYVLRLRALAGGVGGLSGSPSYPNRGGGRTPSTGTVVAVDPETVDGITIGFSW
jgi:hypothetical protein